MTPIVLINGAKQSKISIFNRNIQFGEGLFETCVIENNKILFWVNHFVLSIAKVAMIQIQN